jgi:hypothetical protein
LATPHDRTPTIARCSPNAEYTAQLAGLTILHVDKDFELIAELTGQSTQWLELT